MNWEAWQRQEQIVVLDVSDVVEKLKRLEEGLYNWEEQDWEENKYVYEYDLEYLTGMAVREKM